MALEMYPMLSHHFRNQNALLLLLYGHAARAFGHEASIAQAMP
jgi:hypothetical protein